VTCKCQIPPEGWTCSRESGHDGPCAALPKLSRFGVYYRTPEGEYIHFFPDLDFFPKKKPWYTRVWNWIKREV
jgi:hypothetical protein